MPAVPATSLPPSAPPSVDEDSIRTLITAARSAQQTWATTPIRDRLKLLRRFRTSLPHRHPELLAALSALPRTPAQILTSEILPLADACYFLEKKAAKLLAPKKFGNSGRPTWLGRGSSQIRREPLGTILIIGPSNYPLFIPGVQILQALAAGNAVLVKPGKDSSPAIYALQSLLHAAGLERHLLQILPENPASAHLAISIGVDKVLLTGSTHTGRAVLDQLITPLTPAIMELSGCDALLVLEYANLDRVALAAKFGVLLNHGATCIAPRRLIATRKDAATLEEKIAFHFASATPRPIDPRVFARVRACIEEALASGARIAFGQLTSPENFSPILLANVNAGMKIAHEDLFAPVLSILPVDDHSQIVPTANACPYALGTSIFGADHLALPAASQLRAANIVINDLIAPTVDPRLPFPARGVSGFGSTRGAEGLLELTQLKVVSTRDGSFLPHLDPPQTNDLALFSAYLHASHGHGLFDRLRHALRFLKLAQRRNKP